MASLVLVTTWMFFFILNNLTKSSAETSELKHGNPDWKWLLGKIEHRQDTRLSHFCVRNAIQRNKQTEWNLLAIIHKKEKWSNRQIRFTGPRLGYNIGYSEK